MVVAAVVVTEDGAVRTLGVGGCEVPETCGGRRRILAFGSLSRDVAGPVAACMGTGRRLADDN